MLHCFSPSFHWHRRVGKVPSGASTLFCYRGLKLKGHVLEAQAESHPNSHNLASCLYTHYKYNLSIDYHTFFL